MARPNFLLVLTDTQPTACLGCHGAPNIARNMGGACDGIRYKVDRIIAAC